ncbi:MAG TPA: hypothetical protein VFG50_01575 [Rhodothermales bacterium]|nr:hypothetical protein [Rhodothermales bacterium]
MKTQLLQLKFEVRALLAREPALALPHLMVVWWTQQKVGRHIDVAECRVGPHTEFVLDGFQGSGNSFATVAFKKSQKEPVMLAHHLHAPAQVIRALQQGLPTLITIREPRQAVLSLTSRWPYVTVRQALRSYVRYYEKLEPYAGSFVLSTFDQTTSHLDDVILEVNRRYNTDFVPFEHTEIDVRALRKPEQHAADGARRREIKAEKAREFERPRCQRLLVRAEHVYQRLEPFGVARSTT